MPILDAHGQPIATSRLKGMQSASLGVIRTALTDSPGDVTPNQLAAILEEATQGDLTRQAALFSEMEERDTHLFAELSKRKRALLTLNWNITPPRDATPEESEAAATIQTWLQELPDFEDLLLDLADAMGKGFSCVELEWSLQAGVLGQQAWVVNRFHHRPQGWFMVDKEDPDTLLLRTEGGQGEGLRPLGWMVHIHKATSGYPAQAALSRVLAWPYLYKRWALSDFAQYLEVHGLPFRLGKFPIGATEGERAALLKAVTNLGHDAAAVIPDTMMIEFQEASRGNGDTFLAMLSWADQAMSKAILGGTLTSQADGKSSTNALGNVHNEVRHDILISDATQIAGTLTRDLLHPLFVLNFPASVRPGRFAFETRPPADLSQFAAALPALAALFPIPAEWVREKLGIPAPRAGEEVLGGNTLEKLINPARKENDFFTMKDGDCQNWRTSVSNNGEAQHWCADHVIEKTSKIMDNLGDLQQNKQHDGKNHQCVSLVKDTFKELDVPTDPNWKAGEKIQNIEDFPLGSRAVPIAIFDKSTVDGKDIYKYGNTPGKSHAAVLVGKTDKGIWVYDQWDDRTKTGGHVGLRFYKFGDNSSSSKNASNYRIIVR